MSQREPKLYDFYCCYLLRSIPKPRSFYIGSTPDPVRRLRQHNGDLKSGAYKTKRNGFRPWRTCMIVYGFPSKISALMFEHAWQHPYQTRHITDRITKSKNSGNGLNHRISNVRLLLNSEFFQKMSLQVHIFDLEVYNNWCLNRFKIKLIDNVIVDFDDQVEDEANYIQLKNFLNTKRQQDEQILENLKNAILAIDVYKCNQCDQDMILEESNFTICYHCYSLSHVHCLAGIDKKSLIPKSVECTKCGKHLKWTSVIKYSNLLKKWITSS